MDLENNKNNNNLNSEIKDHKKGHRNRLIKKFLSHSANFSNLDILEILLFLTIPRKNTREIAHELHNKFEGSLLAVMSSDQNNFKEINGLGENSIFFFKMIHEISLRLSREKMEKKNYLNCFDDLINFCKLKIGTKKHEELHIIYLTSKNHIIKDEILFTGTISTVNIYPREIVKKALDIAAAGIILIHNHPSGDVTPSNEDITITQNLFHILQSINVTLCDHIIISGSSFISFRQNKITPF